MIRRDKVAKEAYVEDLVRSTAREVRALVSEATLDNLPGSRWVRNTPVVDAVLAIGFVAMTSPGS